MRQSHRIALSFTRLGLLLLLLSSASPSFALTNGLASTPPMGWNSWYDHGPYIDENLIRSTADAMATNGLKDAGYEYICLDDGWAAYRDTNGVLVADTNTFPGGMKALADYVHAKGFKFGIYTAVGPFTCVNLPASCGHEIQDANTFAAWGVDYLKLDGCSTCYANDTMLSIVQRYAHALLNCGRPIVFAASVDAPADWMPDLLNQWRGTGDNFRTFDSLLHHLDYVAQTPSLAGPGHWNDPDVVNLGLGTKVEKFTAFAMWSMLAAPLLLQGFSDWYMDILTNREVIAVDQDLAGVQGVCVATNGPAQLWCKPLGTNGNTKAVALLNRGETEITITAHWPQLGVPAGTAAVRDLGARAYAGNFTNSYSAKVPAHGVQLFKLTPGSAVPRPPAGTNYLSDLEWLAGTVTTNLFPTKLNQNLVGGPLRLHGVTYSKGLGVTPQSHIEYFLGRAASRFRSAIGVDDAACCGLASVVFRVWADGVTVYDSGVMTSSSPTATIDLDVTGRNVLMLEVSDGGDGIINDFADWADAQIVVLALPPSRPAPLSPVPVPNEITLLWNTDSGAASYIVRRATNSGGPYQVIGSPASALYRDTNVAPNIVYYYLVSAINAYGESPNSTEFSGSLPAYWTNTSTSSAQSWNNSANWTNSADFPNAPGRAAVINSSILQQQTIQLPQPITIGTLSLGAPNSSASYLITGSATLTFNNAASPPALTQLATSKGDTVGVALDCVGNLTINNYSIQPLTLANANLFTGAVTVAAGPLKLGHASALGTSTAGTIVMAGAALDLNGFDIGGEEITAAGFGLKTNGAIVNNALNQTATLRAVALQGDTVVGGNNSWEVRGTNESIPSAILGTGGHAYKFTKVGTNQLSLRSVSVDAALGDIVVKQGTLLVAGATDGLGNPSNSLTVEFGASLALSNTANLWNKHFVLAGDGHNATLANLNGSNTLLGRVTLSGDCLLNVQRTTLAIQGAIDGQGNLHKIGMSPLRLSGTNPYTGDTLVEAGTLMLLNKGSIPNSRSLRIASEALLDVSTLDEGGLPIADGQTLYGNGSIKGNIIVGAGATLAPGLGQLTLSNSLAFADGSTCIIELSKSPAANGQVQVSGAISLAGLLILTNTSNTPLTAGDTFQLFNASTFSGGFSFVRPQIPGPGLLWDTTALTQNGQLRVISGAPPQVTALTIVGNSIIINGTGGSIGLPGKTYYVLTSTNVALPVSQWQRIATNQFNPIGQFSFTNTLIISGTPTFFALQTQ